MSSRAWLPLLLVLWLASGGVPSRSAEDPAPAVEARRNVQITITVGNVEGRTPPGVRTYRMLARDGARARMLMGWRTPIPTARGTGDAGADAPVTTYVYQNVGMTAHLEPRLLEGGKILLDGSIEISGARASVAGMTLPPDMPVIGTFQQEVSAVLEAGKPLRIAEVPDPEGGTLYLELTAKALDQAR